MKRKIDLLHVENGYIVWRTSQKVSNENSHKISKDGKEERRK